MVLYLADRISVGANLPYPDLMEWAQQAGAEPGATKVEAERLLQPGRDRDPVLDVSTHRRNFSSPWHSARLDLHADLRERPESGGNCPP